MFILKKGHQPGVYVPLRALFLVRSSSNITCSQPIDKVGLSTLILPWAETSLASSISNMSI